MPECSSVLEARMSALAHSYKALSDVEAALTAAGAAGPLSAGDAATLASVAAAMQKLGPEILATAKAQGRQVVARTRRGGLRGLGGRCARQHVPAQQPWSF